MEDQQGTGSKFMTPPVSMKIFQGGRTMNRIDSITSKRSNCLALKI